jgi:hypothetical protein
LRDSASVVSPIGFTTGTAIAKVLSRAFPDTHFEIDVFKQLALFCGAGLLVSLLLMTYGLDLSAGFF